MKLENTDFTRQKSSEEERKKEKIKEIKKAEDVWVQKSGGSDELALLYVAMAPEQAAGSAGGSHAGGQSRSRAIFDPDYLRLSQLDDYIAVLTLNGKELYLDPGQKMCPFGLLHWKHTYASGLRAAGKGATMASTPGNTYMQNSVQRVADLTVGPDGSGSGTMRIVMNGQEALNWRQTAIRDDEDEVKKRFNEKMRDIVPDGMQADFDHFLALDDYNSNLVAVLKVSGQLGSATGKRFFLPGMFFESHAKHPFVASDHREIPIDVHYPERLVDDVTYHLPEGFAVESAPQGATIPWASSAQLRVVSKTDKDSVEIARSLAYNFTLLEEKDYNQLRGLRIRKVATADQQQGSWC